MSYMSLVESLQSQKLKNTTQNTAPERGGEAPESRAGHD